MMTSVNSPKTAPNHATRPGFNDCESPLTLLRRRCDAAGAPLIGTEQFAAGERLRADYSAAHMEQRLTANWDLSRSSGFHGGIDAMSDKALAARQRLFAALAAVGPELTTILLEVCCLSAGLEQAERRLGLPRRSAKAILDLALTRLARYYGLLAPDEVITGHPVFRHWAQTGYRPTSTALDNRQ
jgi:hypothetical protein